MIAPIVVERRSGSRRSVWVEVEDDESAPDDASQRSHTVFATSGKVVQDAGHDRLVELRVRGQVLEEHSLEAAIREAPAPAREVEVVGVEIDPEVGARHDLAEPPEPQPVSRTLSEEVAASARPTSFSARCPFRANRA